MAPLIIVIGIVLMLVAVGTASAASLRSNMTSWPGNEQDPLWKAAHAIAHAEGYGPANNAATKLNNPGDLSPGDEYGLPTVGKPEFHGGSYIIHFATPDAGWQALYTKLQRVANRQSKHYNPDMTWAQFAKEYAGDAGDWANNVTAYLGVSVDDRVGDSLGV